MSRTISVRVRHLGRGKASGQRQHDLRKGRVPKYVDRSRTGQNSVIVLPEAEAELRRVCVARREQRHPQRKMRSDAAIATTGIITFGVEAQRVVQGLPVGVQDRLFLESAEAVAQALETTISGLVVHRDEAAVHAHFQCPAVGLRGWPASRHLRRAEIGRLQDVAARPWAALGIRRGTAKVERVKRGDPSAATIHRSVHELHYELPAELDARRAQLRELRERLAEAQAEFDQLLAEEKALERYKEGRKALSEAQAEMRRVVGKLREWERGLRVRERELNAREERIAARARALRDSDSPSAG